MRVCSACDRPLSLRRSTSRGAALVLAAWCLAACGRTPAPDFGGESRDADSAVPVVLVTFSSLRADLVSALGGEEGWTPQLDRFAAEADWRGTAVAASSSPVTALAGLLTGVDPWQHQVLDHVDAHLEPGLPTLPRALATAGYHTSALVPFDQRLQSFGLLDGFDRVLDLGADPEAGVRALAGLGAEPRMVWVHLPDSGFPYRDRRADLPRLAGRPATPLPEVELRWLMPYADPELRPSDELDRSARELYRHGVAWGDHRAGRLLDALRSGGAWQRSLVVVTAVVGTEFEEHGQVLYAQNLGRESIEVPLLVKLPRGLRRSVAEPDGGRVAAARLWATLVEAAGGRAAPVHAPSLFRRSNAPMLSALYARNGSNHFSAVFPSAPGDGAEQLLWRAPFADPEPELYVVQAVQAGRGDIHPSEPPERILRRLRRGFRRTAPLLDARGDAVALTLERWLPTGGFEAVDDPGRARELAAELHRGWRRFVDRQLPPAQEQRRRRDAADGAAGDAAGDIVPRADDKPTGP